MTAHKKPWKVENAANLQQPSSESWLEIEKEFELAEREKRLLYDVIADTLADIRVHDSMRKNRKTLNDFSHTLEAMDKNFKNLKKQLARNRASLVQLFSVPSLEKMGMAFSFEGISAALGRDVAPVMPPEAIRLLDVEARANSVAAMETFYATMRADFGLTRPGELIGYMLDLLHEPIEKKLKLKKQDKGGRTPNVYKRFMIETLALAAPRVLCPDANDPTDRRIIDFNVFVMPRCGFTEAGIDKATADCLRKKKSLKKKVGEIVGRS